MNEHPVPPPSHATLCVDHKAGHVTQKDVELVTTPPAEGRWCPIGHGELLQLVNGTMQAAGFQVARQSLALSNDNQRFFATLDLQAEVVSGVTLAVGIRNSIDKSLSAAVCLGERVFVCSNLCFGGEAQIARKHTANALPDLERRLTAIVATIEEYRQASASRIEKMRRTLLTDDAARSLMLRLAEAGVIGWRLLPKLLFEWAHPRHEEFEVRSVWSLLNAATELLKGRQEALPIAAASQTMALQSYLASAYALAV